MRLLEIVVLSWVATGVFGQGTEGAVASETLGGAQAAPVCSAQPCRFDCTGEEEHWRLAIMPYLWAASFKGNVTVKGVTSTADVPFTDILKGLDYAAIGQVELQKGRFFIIPDTVLLKLSESVSVDGSRLGRFGLVNVKGKVSASADVFQYFQELVGGYRVYERCLSQDGCAPRSFAFDLLGGMRYYYISSSVTATTKVTVDRPGGPVTRERSGTLSGSENWIDPIIGARMKYDATDRLELSLRGDVGGFGVGSDLAWSATALGKYKVSDCWSLFGGYRVLDIDYSNGDTGLNATMAGPVIGAQYKISF